MNNQYKTRLVYELPVERLQSENKLTIAVARIFFWGGRWKNINGIKGLVFILIII